MIGDVHWVGLVAKLGVVIKLSWVEDSLVRMVLKLIKATVRVVIRIIFMLFRLILKYKL